ncbi:hypothetical protein KY345_05770 [Candidatus Woesearchaeota archaeon]|nr:hypothetical protein [Candidatus Woesearchaeota archaeon]
MAKEEKKEEAKEEKKEVKGGGGDGKACAILAYLLVGIIWYFADEKMKKNNFVKHHVKQGLNLLIISIVLSVLWGVLGMTLVLIPVIMVAAPIVNIILLVLWIFGLVYAINGKTKPVPVVGMFANKYLTF